MLLKDVFVSGDHVSPTTFAENRVQEQEARKTRVAMPLQIPGKSCDFSVQLHPPPWSTLFAPPGLWKQTGAGKLDGKNT